MSATLASTAAGYCRGRDWLVITSCDEVFQAARRARVPIGFSSMLGYPFIVHRLYADHLLEQLRRDGVPLVEVAR